MREITWDTTCRWMAVFCSCGGDLWDAARKLQNGKCMSPVPHPPRLNDLLAPSYTNTGIARPTMITSVEIAADYYEAVHTQVVWCWMESLIFLLPLAFCLPG